MAFESHPKAISLANETKQTRAKIDARVTKLKALDETHELDSLAINQIKKDIEAYQLKIIENENLLKTTFNIQNRLNKIMNVAKIDSSKITSIHQIPFKDIFDQVLVVSRTHLKFIVNLYSSDEESVIKETKENYYEFLIRKTPHQVKIEIVFK